MIQTQRLKKVTQLIIPATLKASLFASSIVFAGTTTAFAADASYVGGSYLMAYAEIDVKVDRSFSYSDYSDEAHVLNDAWLGMPAVSREGQLVGLVSDALIDEHGNVSKIRLDLSGKEYMVLVEGSQVVLWDTVVAIDLPTANIADLRHKD